MHPKEESFVLPGETGSVFKLFLKAQAREFHEDGALEIVREMMRENIFILIRKTIEVRSIKILLMKPPKHCA